MDSKTSTIGRSSSTNDYIVRWVRTNYELHQTDPKSIPKGFGFRVSLIHRALLRSDLSDEVKAPLLRETSQMIRWHAERASIDVGTPMHNTPWSRLSFAFKARIQLVREAIRASFQQMRL